MRGSCLACVAVLLVACGEPEDADAGIDGGSEGDAGLDGGSIESDAGMSDAGVGVTCEDVVQAGCDWYARCYGLTDCSETAAAPVFAYCERSEEAIAAGRVAFNPEGAQACIALHESTPCGTSGAPINTHDACPDVFTGLVAPGEECFYQSSYGNDECAEGYCRYVDGTCPGICAPYREVGDTCDPANAIHCDPTTSYCDFAGRCVALVAEGGDCNGAACEAGLVCLSNGIGLMCAELAEAGEDCFDFTWCVAPLACAADGSCTMNVASGEPCRTSANCPAGQRCGTMEGEFVPVCHDTIPEGGECTDTALCAEGTFCGYEVGTLVQRCLPRGGPGEPCAAGCEPGLWCQRTSDTDPGICRIRGGEGDGCTDYRGAHSAYCQPGMYCVANGTCQPPGELGEPCSWNEVESCVDGFYCDRATDRCAEPGGEGDTCNPVWTGTSCLSGLYCYCGSGVSCPFGGSEPSPLDVCAPRVANGEPCVVHAQCTSGYCDIDECTDPPPSGCPRLP
jgi:hypothetical protein